MMAMKSCMASGEVLIANVLKEMNGAATEEWLLNIFRRSASPTVVVAPTQPETTGTTQSVVRDTASAPVTVTGIVVQQPTTTSPAQPETTGT